MWHFSFRDLHMTCFMSSYSHCMLAILRWRSWWNRWRSWWNRWWSMTCFISLSAYDMFHVVIFTSSVVDTYLERELTSTVSCLNCNTLQHTATHCNTLQHTATHCNTLQHITRETNLETEHTSSVPWLDCYLQCFTRLVPFALYYRVL